MRWIGIGLGLLAACSSMSREEQLKRVARDWCQTIRASQVIPVYPLTQDLQPGDVFLVQKTVEEQHADFDERGFLPLDNHVGRFDPTRYEAFYGKSFPVGSNAMPRHWLTGDWKDAPHAAFPSYSFSTKRGGGFSIALPISGVPVGLSLLGAHNAVGSVTIAAAHTYGLDSDSIYHDFLEWVVKHGHFIENYRSTDDSSCASSRGST